MAIQTINIGTNPNDGTGDDLRTAFDKVNDNFAELLAVGGETNTASNLGLGAKIFKEKVDLDFKFRTLKSGNANLTVTEGTNEITLTTTPIPQNAFTQVGVDGGSDYVTATTSTSAFVIQGGTNISTRIDAGQPNNVIIDAVLEVVNDSTPQLGGNLDLVGNDIVDSTGASDINILGNIRSATMNANIFTGDLKGSVFGDDSTPIIDGTSNTVNADVNGNLTGNVTGSLLGSLGSDLDLNTFGITGAGRLAFRALNSDPDEIVNGGNTFVVQVNDQAPSAKFVISTSNTDEASNFLEVESQTTGSIADGFGTGISFNIGEGTVAGTQEIGFITAKRESSTVNSLSFSASNFNLGDTFNEQLTLRSNNEILLGAGDPQIRIKEGLIETFGASNSNLQLNADGTGYIDFYSAYQFPRTIGNAGEVLTVPLSGTLLEWGAGGGGGGGSSTFVGLTDTPSSYAGSAADALKMVRVAASGTALEFVTVDSVIDATYIEGKGFLPKGGGTMSGDINLDSNNITNGTNITTTNLFVSTIDSSDSSAITFTPGVTMNSFLTVESSLNVLDTTNTKTLTVSGNADVTGNTTIGGTLTADNFVLSGGGAPSFTSGSDIVFSAVGQLTTNAPLVPNTDNNITLGTASFKYSNVYATTFTGNVTGNVTGNLTGQVTGDVTGSVVADDSTPLVDGVSGKLVGPVDTSTVDATSVTATANVGADTLTFTTLASGPQVTVTNKFEGPWVDVDRATIGNLAIDGNNIEAGSNDIIRLRGNGTGYIELDGNTHINGVVSYSNNEDINIAGTATPATLSTGAPVSFVTTQNWVSVGADFAYANLADATAEGQIKTIKMVNRGEFSTNGGATFTDRYLVVNLTINGGSGTLNVSENSEFGAVTLVWHTNSWWVIGKVDS